MNAQSEYAAAGVDPAKITPFKRAMQEVGKKTAHLPRKREVEAWASAHDVCYRYTGNKPHVFVKTLEGLGNKDWIAQWMYQHGPTGKSFFDDIGADTAFMAVNDTIANGALPVVYVDEVAAPDSDWFTDPRRSQDLADGFFAACFIAGMALLAGESPAYRYLIRAEPPVTGAPVLGGCVTGILAPSTIDIGEHRIRPGDHIIGVASSGLHANGISLVIKRALTLPDQFLTTLPNGYTLGEEALIPTRSYVALVEELVYNRRLDVHAFLPGTGDGVAKLGVYRYTKRIHSWLPVPPLFLFLRELGVSTEDLLTTFNWGVGYYIFVAPKDVNRTLDGCAGAGYTAADVGSVEEGPPITFFGPEGNMPLYPQAG